MIEIGQEQKKVSRKDKIAAKKEFKEQQFSMISTETFDVEEHNSAVKELHALTDDCELPIRVQRFCDEYVIHYNEEKAAEKSGWPIWDAANIGKILLSNKRVKREIELRQQRITRELNITQERVMTELASVAYVNMQDFYNKETGKLIPIQELPRNLAAAIEEVVYDRKGNLMKYRLIPKTYGLDALGKNLGLFDKDVDRKLPVDFKQFLKMLPEDIQEQLKISLAKRIGQKK